MKNPTATSEEAGAKAGHCACTLHMAPSGRWADHLSRPSGLSPHPPYRHPIEGSRLPLSIRDPAGGPLPCVCTLLLQQESQPCQPFLSGVLPISITKEPGNFISNILCKETQSPSWERIWAPPGLPNAASFCVTSSLLNL